jgi:hypothetical protein
MDTKICFKCGEEKLISEFYNHPKMKDGILGKCKSCTKKDVKENRIKNQEYYIEYDKQRGNTEARKLTQAKHRIKYREQYPEKYRAHNLLGNALRNQRICKEPCEICGDLKSEAHHPDYSKPLEVIWLCRKHHHKVTIGIPF